MLTIIKPLSTDNYELYYNIWIIYSSKFQIKHIQSFSTLLAIINKRLISVNSKLALRYKVFFRKFNLVEVLTGLYFLFWEKITGIVRRFVRRRFWESLKFITALRSWKKTEKCSITPHVGLNLVYLNTYSISRRYKLKYFYIYI